ncbi:hypothetical protein AN618_12810 [Fervidicola ferrireducens]|uniref:GGDEF domain-containing protein n=1 Tax=Fervidicola ferrireducens TaxID=520764 RepID=A0A140L9M7_9FIRM|nr:hypothetical protein AN618_12810 [Fervidicola ferrireducens]
MQFYDRLKISIIFLLQFIMFIIYLNFFAIEDFSIYLIFMVFIYISILIGGSLYGFVTLTMTTFAVAFWQVYTAWINGSRISFQITLILKQIMGIIFLILFWVMLSEITNITVENRKMKEKLKILERTDEITGVLTKSELIERFKIIFTSMQRRNQSGYFVVLRWAGLNVKSRGKTYYSGSIARIIGQVCLNSIRRQYDLAGSLGNNTLLIVLQNTNLEGAQIVVGRIKENLKKEERINASVLLEELDFQIHPIPTNLDEAVEFINCIAGECGGIENVK